MKRIRILLYIVIFFITTIVYFQWNSFFDSKRKIMEFRCYDDILCTIYIETKSYFNFSNLTLFYFEEAHALKYSLAQQKILSHEKLIMPEIADSYFYSQNGIWANIFLLNFNLQNIPLYSYNDKFKRKEKKVYLGLNTPPGSALTLRTSDTSLEIISAEILSPKGKNLWDLTIPKENIPYMHINGNFMLKGYDGRYNLFSIRGYWSEGIITISKNKESINCIAILDPKTWRILREIYFKDTSNFFLKALCTKNESIFSLHQDHVRNKLRVFQDSNLIAEIQFEHEIQNAIFIEEGILFLVHHHNKTELYSFNYEKNKIIKIFCF